MLVFISHSTIAISHPPSFSPSLLLPALSVLHFFVICILNTYTPLLSLFSFLSISIFSCLTFPFLSKPYLSFFTFSSNFFFSRYSSSRPIILFISSSSSASNTILSAYTVQRIHFFIPDSYSSPLNSPHFFLQVYYHYVKEQRAQWASLSCPSYHPKTFQSLSRPCYKNLLPIPVPPFLRIYFLRYPIPPAAFPSLTFFISSLLFSLLIFFSPPLFLLHLQFLSYVSPLLIIS